MANRVSFLRVLSIWWQFLGIWTSPSLTVGCSPTLVCLSGVQQSQEQWEVMVELVHGNSRATLTGGGCLRWAISHQPSLAFGNVTHIGASSLPPPAASGLHQAAAEEGAQHRATALSSRVRKASPDGSHEVHFQVWVHRYWKAPSALKWSKNCTQWNVLVSLIGKYGRGKKSHIRKSQFGEIYQIPAWSKAELLHFTAQRF